jgi:hypothetical protein
MININNDAITNLINTTILHSIFNNINTSSYLQNPENQMPFLQRKRSFDYNYIDNNYQNIVQRNYHFNHLNISNTDINEFKESVCNNRIEQFKFGKELIRPDNIKCDGVNINNLRLNNNLFNCSNSSPNKENINKSYLKSNTIINNDYKLNENKVLDVQKTEENLNYNNNSTDLSNTPSPTNNTISSKSTKKINYFKVINTKNENGKTKKRKRKIIKQTENNNEIKVLKNNKVVYVNNFLLNSYSTSKNIKKLDKIAFIRRNKRSSRFRGVSKNGNQWQVLMMIKKRKLYVGSFASEELAARIYDVLTIKSRGIRARTNFIYTSKQIKNIYDKDIDIKSKNIYEVISQLVA